MMWKLLCVWKVQNAAVYHSGEQLLRNCGRKLSTKYKLAELACIR